MDIKHIIGVLALVAIVFFGTVFMFVYKTSSPRPITNTSQTNSSTQTTASSSAQTPNSATTTSTSASVQNNSTNNSQQNSSDPYETDCVVQKKAAAAGKNYEKGSVLVTFQETMDFETAVKTIELLRSQLGVKVEDSLDARNNFRQNHWFEVTVPASSEFRTQCELEQSEGVKRTTPNFLFSLRQ